MEEPTVYALLDELSDIVTNAHHIMFTNSVRVNLNEMLDQIDAIRNDLPECINHAETILMNRREILKEADNEAERIVKAAEKNADNLVSESSIIAAAQDEAQKIIDLAKQNAKEIKASARSYAYNVLQDMGSFVKEINDDIDDKLSRFEER